MLNPLSTTLLTLGGVGTVFLFVEWLLMATRLPAKRPAAGGTPLGVSILKPLCGVDDALEENLHSYAEQVANGVPFEVILGVKSPADAAFPVAQAVVERWPHIFRLHIQRGEPGLNPKVNQLITLSAHACYPICVISDSNVRVPVGYVEEISQQFQDPQVGCLAHPIAGVGEHSLGALLSNLLVMVTSSAGMVATARLRALPLVTGKSLALRRSDLELLGGFERLKDVLAEDFVLTSWVHQLLKKRVVVSSETVDNVCAHGTLRQFFSRHLRWSVIQRSVVPFPAYASQVLLNPIPLALLGLCLAPSALRLAAFSAVVCLSTGAQLLMVDGFRDEPLPWFSAPALVLKDLLLFAGWLAGLVKRTVNWRGNILRIGPGSVLTRHHHPAPETPARLERTVPLVGGQGDVLAERP